MSLEETALSASYILRDLGAMLYGGPAVAFAVVMLARDFVPKARIEDIVRVFRAWGPGFGLSMGAWVLGLLLSYWLERGEFAWSLVGTAEIVNSAFWLAFLALWVHNLRVEVWTLDPVRTLDKAEGIEDRAAFDAAAANLGRVLGLHAVLVLLVFGLHQARMLLGA